MDGFGDPRKHLTCRANHRHPSTIARLFGRAKSDLFDYFACLDGTVSERPGDRARKPAGGDGRLHYRNRVLVIGLEE